MYMENQVTVDSNILTQHQNAQVTVLLIGQTNDYDHVLMFVCNINFRNNPEIKRIAQVHESPLQCNPVMGHWVSSVKEV